MTKKFPKNTDREVFSRILHDWPIQKCNYLLKRAHNALPPGGAVMIVESLIDEYNVERLSTFLGYLAMLYCTKGEQFEMDEIEAMLRSAGFDNISMEAIASDYNMITGQKA